MEAAVNIHLRSRQKNKIFNIPEVNLLMMINALLARATILSVEFPDLLFLCFSSIKLFPEFSAGRNQAKAKK